MIKTEITGSTKIFRNDDKGFANYVTSLGKQKADKSGYDNAYIEVKFKKGVEVENGTLIDIAKGFLSFRQYEVEGKKRTVWYIMVLDFDSEFMDKEPPEDIPDNFTAVNDNVPF